MRRPGIWVANGIPSDPIKMLKWRPGALTCLFDYLGPNRVLDYKEQHPETTVIIRFQHPRQWHRDSTNSARYLGEMVASKWPDLKTLNPYVFFANEVNLHYENGDNNVANQPVYESAEFYERYARWVKMTADVIKQAAPDMKLVCPPFAFGHHEDGAPDDNGQPTEPWAGFDFLADTIKSHFDNTLCFHSYWGHGAGSVHDWLYDPKLSSWYAFRWRRVLKLFEARYDIKAKVLVDEAGGFGASDRDFTDQVMYHARQCLKDSRVLGVTYFLWQDPTYHDGNLPNSWVDSSKDLDQHVARLTAMSDVPLEDEEPADNDQPAAPPSSTPEIPDLPIPVQPAVGSIRGQVRDMDNRPVAAARLGLSRMGWEGETVSNRDGTYGFQNLAAGVYTLTAVDFGVEHDKLILSTGQDMELNLQIQLSQKTDSWNMHIEHKDGLPLIVGAMPRAGIEVILETPIGSKFKTLSGEKAEYGVGGFEYWAPIPGVYKLHFLDQTFELPMDGQFTHVVFTEMAGGQAVSEGVISGVLRDQSGNPLAGQQINLTSPGLSRSVSSGPDGSYRFDRLPTGNYTLTVVGSDLKQLAYSNGRSPVTLDLGLQPVGEEQWMMKVTRRSGSPMIVGSLPEAGIPLSISTPSGAALELISGSSSQYGEGGFELYAPQRGSYTIQFQDQAFVLQMDGQLTQIHFVQGSGLVEAQARVVSGWMPANQAQDWLQRFESNPESQGIFTLEDL